MIAEEKARRFLKRSTKGDASETGIVRFITPALMQEYGGFIEAKQFSAENALEAIRAKYPVRRGADKTELAIPFNSGIKFNLIIRDMGNDQTTVYLKGAPEKVLKRVSKILLKDDAGNLVEEEYDAIAAFETEAANSRFGLMGERVLAFARIQLDSRAYPSNYAFDTKDWAKWDGAGWTQDSPNKPAGWFPMAGLTLVGLVSLNDPPRPKVDVSVQKCRAAGVKVIMVTGDQPPTAAAIAHKVNIITDPAKEFNTILENELGADGKPITEEEALEKCQAIVIHGDKLARVHASEEALDDDEIEKGRTVMSWIRKDEVVFARTTPSQKL